MTDAINLLTADLIAKHATIRDMTEALHGALLALKASNLFLTNEHQVSFNSDKIAQIQRALAGSQN